MPHRAATTAERIRYGLTGLAVAFLIILLGSIVSRSGRDDNAVATANGAESQPKEPLAELGVAPGPESAEPAQNGGSKSK